MSDTSCKTRPSRILVHSAEKLLGALELVWVAPAVACCDRVPAEVDDRPAVLHPQELVTARVAKAVGAGSIWSVIGHLVGARCHDGGNGEQCDETIQEGFE